MHQLPSSISSLRRRLLRWRAAVALGEGGVGRRRRMSHRSGSVGRRSTALTCPAKDAGGVWVGDFLGQAVEPITAVDACSDPTAVREFSRRSNDISHQCGMKAEAIGALRRLRGGRNRHGRGLRSRRRRRIGVPLTRRIQVGPRSTRFAKSPLVDSSI